MLEGTYFGFRVINDSAELNYSAPTRKVKANNLRTILEDKILEELEQNMLTIIPQPVTCNHAIFCRPKDGGG